MSVRFFAIVIAIALFIAGTSGVVFLHDLDLKDRLEAAEAKMEAMAREHESTLKAIDDAMTAREEAYAQNAKLLEETEKALCRNPDFGDMLVPDDLRLLWQSSCPAPDASGDSAQRH